MLRPMLGVLIVGASIAIGCFLSSRLSRRRTVLDAYIRLLEEASGRMRFSGESLAAVYSQNFAGFRFDAASAFAPQWERMMQPYRDVLNAGDRQILSDFARGAGGGDIDAELRHIALYQSLLRSRLDEARADCERKGKLYRILPFSLGLVLTLLLL